MVDGTEALTLNLEQLDDVRRALAQRLGEGLARDGAEIAALPAFLPPPPAGLAGEAVVVDLGGTNLRAALVRLEADGGVRVPAGPLKHHLMMRDGETATREAFFARQAKLVDDLGAAWPQKVGYVFSFPSDVQEDRDALLLRWTKDIEIPGVIGTRVGAGLAEALENVRCEPTSVTVLNDTVAALMGGAHGFRGPATNVIGLIIGTGTNMAAFFDSSQAPKLSARGLEGDVAVNLESGNFDPPHLSRWDDELDAESVNPGRQRFEKAVSGHYLPLLFERLTGTAVPDGGALVARRGQGSEEAEIAGLLLARSADLVSAGLAAIIGTRPEGPIGILAEGGLCWGDPAYAPRVRARLKELCPDRDVELLHLEDANLVGAAAAALVP